MGIHSNDPGGHRHVYSSPVYPEDGEDCVRREEKNKKTHEMMLFSPKLTQACLKHLLLDFNLIRYCLLRFTVKP